MNEVNQTKTNIVKKARNLFSNYKKCIFNDIKKTKRITFISNIFFVQNLKQASDKLYEQ